MPSPAATNTLPLIPDAFPGGIGRIPSTRRTYLVTTFLLGHRDVDALDQVSARKVTNGRIEDIVICHPSRGPVHRESTYRRESNDKGVTLDVDIDLAWAVMFHLMLAQTSAMQEGPAVLTREAVIRAMGWKPRASSVASVVEALAGVRINVDGYELRRDEVTNRQYWLKTPLSATLFDDVTPVTVDPDGVPVAWSYKIGAWREEKAEPKPFSASLLKMDKRAQNAQKVALRLWHGLQTSSFASHGWVSFQKLLEESGVYAGLHWGPRWWETTRSIGESAARRCQEAGLGDNPRLDVPHGLGGRGGAQAAFSAAEFHVRTPIESKQRASTRRPSKETWRPADLVAARRVKGLTQEEVAQQIGVDVRTYRRYEKGPMPRKQRVLKALFDLLATENTHNRTEIPAQRAK